VAARKPEEPTRPPLTVIIDPGTGSGAPSLVEASRAAKALRKSAQAPIAVITDENLSDYASRGKLTIIGPEAELPSEAPDPADAEGEAGTVADSGGGEPGEGSTAHNERYWREGARELRLLWRQAIDATSELAERAEALRLQFYSEENVFVRDTQIKPAWDRVLDRLDEARLDSQRYRTELVTFLDEGRRAGALPGWLREGIELEPAVEPETATDDLETLESTEPVIVEEGKPRP